MMDYPFCTFDFADFCTLLANRSEADFLQANISGLDALLSTVKEIRATQRLAPEKRRQHRLAV